MASDSTTSSWPRTRDGAIDWETVFEHPDTGFIPLIMQAPSAAALRKSTIFVIRSIYGDETSEDEVQGFIAEIDGMLPDEVPPPMLPKLAEAVASILRDIKTDRMRRSPVPPPSPTNDSPTKPKRVKPRGVVKRKPPKQKLAAAQWLGIGLAVLVVGGGAGYGGYAYLNPTVNEELVRTEKLIDEMTAAKAGGGPDTHEFGWALTVEKRGGLIGVTANGIPVGPCVAIAWHFVNEPDSNVLINDRLPEKFGPSILKKFCQERGTSAKVLWLSKDPNPGGVDEEASSEAETSEPDASNGAVEGTPETTTN